MRNRKLQNILFLFLGLGGGVLPLHSEEELPQSMASLGDSISAAAFAHFDRKDAWTPFLLPKFLAMIAKLGVKRSVAAVEEPQYSWTTGLSRKFTVKSHAHRLKFLNSQKGHAFSVFGGAVSRQESVHLEEQLDTVLEWSRRQLGQETPDYVTLLVGPNDVCRDYNDEMTSTFDFHSRVEDVVDRLYKKNPNFKLLLSTIPNVAYLREAAIDSKVGPLSNCQKVWNTHHFCPNLLEEDDSEKRAEVSERIEDYNEAIFSIRDKYNALSASDNIRVAEDVYAYQFSDDDLSIDCFHPNARGQDILSEITWQSSWWGGESWNQGAKHEFDDYVQSEQRKIKRKEQRRRRNWRK